MPTNLFSYGAPSPAASNPNPFFRVTGAPRGLDTETAYKVRRDAKRTVVPAAAALAAQEYLLDPTLRLAGRGAEGYGALFRRESDAARRHAVDQLRETDPEGFDLLGMLTRDASGLVGRGADAYEDAALVESVRAGDAARGLVYSPSSALRETLSLDRARDERRMARGSYGAGIFDLRNRYLQQDAAAAPWAQLTSPVVGTSTDDLLSIDINDVQARRNQKAAKRAAQMGLIGSGIEAVGSIVGGFARRGT